MPNYCENDLIIEGKQEQINAFKVKAMKSDGSVLDFGNFFQYRGFKNI